jgi:hypothetical protein
MAPPLTPGLHDLVFWRGARWLVTKVLLRGRLELGCIVDPTVQAVCLAEQLHWVAGANAWVLTALPMPTRGQRCED